MKILHIMNYYHEKFGYQEQCLAKKQQELGHNVLIVTSDYYFPFPNYDKTMQDRLGERHVGTGEFFDDNLKVLRNKSWFRSIKCPGIIYFPISGVLSEYKPDIVHVHGATNLTIPGLCLHQRKYKYKIFVDNHMDDSVSNYTESPVDRIYYGIWRFFYHSLGFKKRISQFFPITGRATTWLAERLNISGSQMTLSPLGVDLETMSYDKDNERKFRADHGIGEKLVIVNAGKQYSQKRIDWIIDVAVAARNLGVNLYLVLVGNAETEYDAVINKKLEDLGPNHLRLPFLDREELSKVYSAADIGIWPGIPSNTIQEAMACRVALILPNDDIVGHLIDGNGLADSQNVNAAAEFIQALYQNKDLLEEYKSKSEQLAFQYSWEHLSNDLLDIYQRN